MLTPVASDKWPNVSTFVPAYQATLVGTYLLASYLIYGYFLQTRIRSLLWLWSGCVYTAAVLVAQFLSLPGAFIAGKRLLGGGQTTIWLWFFWHIGASGMLLGYAFSEWRSPGRLVTNKTSSLLRTAFWTLVATVATLVTVTVLHDMLPVQDIGGDYNRVTTTGYGPLIQVILFAALFFLWRASRFATPISAWLGVAILALACDNFITMAGGARLSVGWYVGRLNALLSAVVMLALYLQTIHRVYLNAVANARKLTLANRELELHQEQLEVLVRQRTQSLEETRNALLHAQKLEAIGKLTGGVAHDFNNVLHIISGNLDLIRMLSGANEKVEQRCASARDAVRRGARLSSQLLAFARKQPLQPAATSMAEVFANMDELLKRAVGERIAILLEMAPDTRNVKVDRQQLENVILNLSLNASDAISNQGTLTIRISNTSLSDSDAARLQLSSAEYVSLEFTDTGCGMTADVRERAFEPFFSTKGLGKGTGLGLSMAYGFVKQSGGNIDIVSEPGQGTTVTIYLPSTTDTTADKKLEIAIDAAGGTETILVVDDETAILDNVVDILAPLGYRTLKASNADEASVVLRQGGTIDLLFTDVVMPGTMTSPQLAMLARQLHPGIKVLFTSGYSEDAITQNGTLKQGVGLLPKPYNKDDLARAIRSSLTGNKALLDGPRVA
jgi:signal transduction histidine kinase/ActR/RegA family two-component response regulator